MVGLAAECWELSMCSQLAEMTHSGICVRVSTPEGVPSQHLALSAAFCNLALMDTGVRVVISTT